MHQIRTGSSIWATTSTNGAPIGTIRGTTRTRPHATHRGLVPVAANPPVAVHGGTTSRSRAARPGRAFLLSSSTLTTAFASHAKRFEQILLRPTCQLRVV